MSKRQEREDDDTLMIAPMEEATPFSFLDDGFEDENGNLIHIDNKVQTIGITKRKKSKLVALKVWI